MIGGIVKPLRTRETTLDDGHSGNETEDQAGDDEDDGIRNTKPLRNGREDHDEEQQDEKDDLQVLRGAETHRTGSLSPV
jgi:hypothetical protein